MGNVISSLFGKKPKKPPLVTQVQPIEKILQGDVEKDKILRDFAKRRKATMLNQVTGEPAIKTQKLGAMA